MGKNEITSMTPAQIAVQAARAVTILAPHRIAGGSGVEQLELSGLVTMISADGGKDEALAQVDPVLVECQFRDGRVFRVTTLEAVTFSGPTAMLSRMAGYSVTDLCDLDGLTARVADQVNTQAMRRAAERRQAARELAVL